MLLEKLPTELVRRIVHALVDQIDIPATWRLRLVCKTFATVIPDEFEKVYHMNNFDVGTYRCKVGGDGLGNFLASKSATARDIHPDLPTTVTDVANFLISFGTEHEIEDLDMAHHRVVSRLYLVLGTQSERRLASTIYTLGNGYSNTASGEESTLQELEVIADRMAGAIVFGNHAALQECLDRGADVWCKSRAFGHILALAATHGTLDTLNYLLDELDVPPSGKIKIKSTHAHFAQIHRMFLKSIIAAFSAGRISIARSLAGTYAVSIVKVPVENFDQLLTAAILSEDVMAVEITLSIAVGVYYKVKWKHFEEAVVGGSPGVLRTILPQLKEDSSHHYGCRSTAEYVVMYGQLCQLKEVLHMDNLSGTWNKDVNQALAIARKYNKQDMVSMLRDYKAKVVDGAISREVEMNDLAIDDD